MNEMFNDIQSVGFKRGSAPRGLFGYEKRCDIPNHFSFGERPGHVLLIPLQKPYGKGFGQGSGNFTKRGPIPYTSQTTADIIERRASGNAVQVNQRDGLVLKEEIFSMRISMERG